MAASDIATALMALIANRRGDRGPKPIRETDQHLVYDAERSPDVLSTDEEVTACSEASRQVAVDDLIRHGHGATTCFARANRTTEETITIPANHNAAGTWRPPLDRRNVFTTRSVAAPASLMHPSRVYRR